MRMPTSHQARKQLVKEALKEKAPRMFRELERSGKLEQFLDDRADDMWQAYLQDHMQVLDEAQKEGQKAGDWLKLMRDQNAALSRLTEQVLSTWLEFSDLPTTASERES
jgi:hypothetical protein